MDIGRDRIGIRCRYYSSYYYRSVSLQRLGLRQHLRLAGRHPAAIVRANLFAVELVGVIQKPQPNQPSSSKSEDHREQQRKLTLVACTRGDTRHQRPQNESDKATRDDCLDRCHRFDPAAGHDAPPVLTGSCRSALQVKGIERQKPCPAVLLTIDEVLSDS